MTWLLVLVLTTGGTTQSVPWAMTAAKSVCGLTGGAVAQLLEAEFPSMTVRYVCFEQVTA